MSREGFQEGEVLRSKSMGSVEMLKGRNMSWGGEPNEPIRGTGADRRSLIEGPSAEKRRGRGVTLRYSGMKKKVLTGFLGESSHIHKWGCPQTKKVLKKAKKTRILYTMPEFKRKRNGREKGETNFKQG